MSTFKTTVRALHAWVRPALVTTGKDEMLPVLCHARLIVAERHALLVSTDRFAASLSRVRFDPKADPVAPVVAHVHRNALERALAVFRLPRGRVDPELAVTVTEDRVRFEGMGLAFDAETLTSPPNGLPVNFPDVLKIFRQILDPADAPAFAAPMQVDFAKLAAFRVAHRRNQTTTVVQTAGGVGKPYVFRMGDDYLGLLMPRRAHGSDEAPTPIADGWADALATPKENA